MTILRLLARLALYPITPGLAIHAHAQTTDTPDADQGAAGSLSYVGLRAGRFGYTADDGRGGTDNAEVTVTIPLY